jgi:CBS domain-containing protein
MRTGVRVSDAMTFEPIVITPKTKLQDAAKLMQEKEIGSLVVLEDNELKGIVTEWDIVRKAVAEGKDTKAIQASDIMATNLVTIDPNKDIYEALTSMRNNDVRHLPVVSKKKLVGYLTLKDILKIQPELFDIMVENFKLREELSKPVGRRQAKGSCAMCGIESNALFDDNGIFLCRNCKHK